MGVFHDDHLVQRGDQGPVADGRGVQGDPPALHQPSSTLYKLLFPIQQRHHYGLDAQNRARQLQDVICARQTWALLPAPILLKERKRTSKAVRKPAPRRFEQKQQQFNLFPDQEHHSGIACIHSNDLLCSLGSI